MMGDRFIVVDTEKFVDNLAVLNTCVTCGNSTINSKNLVSVAGDYRHQGCVIPERRDRKGNLRWL